jgi:hypothetical protein
LVPGQGKQVEQKDTDMDMDMDTADAIVEMGEDSAQISKVTPDPQPHDDRHSVAGDHSSCQAKTGVDDYGAAALTTVET